MKMYNLIFFMGKKRDNKVFVIPFQPKRVSNYNFVVSVVKGNIQNAFGVLLLVAICQILMP
jgi:hypothetical protein